MAEILPMTESHPQSTEGDLDIPRGIGRVLFTSAVAAGLIVASAAAAEADSPREDHVYSIVNTDGAGAWLHGDPGLGDEDDLVRVMPEGMSFDADCYVLDTPIGPNGNEIWLHGTDETGATGYFTDHYSDSEWSNRTGNTLLSQGLPFCDEATTEDSGLSSDEMIYSLPYDPTRATNWALTHATDTPPYDASCTWFVSNALWAGGLEKTTEWTDEGSHGTLLHRPGTRAAWSVESFARYILDEYPGASVTTLEPDTFKANKVANADVGDVMMYDWEGDGEIDHASMITNIAEGQYPEVSGWSEGSDGSQSVDYVRRGWTYSEVRDEWLQEKYPNATAYLIDLTTVTSGF